MVLNKYKDRWKQRGGCKIWTGSTDGKGRPHVKQNGKSLTVARLVCEESYGSPPEGAFACHKRECNNIKCVEGSHLYWGSKSDNELDKRDYDMRYISESDGQYLVRVKGKYVGWYSTLESAKNARNIAQGLDPHPALC